jgi:hypothetical protein
MLNYYIITHKKGPPKKAAPKILYSYVRISKHPVQA